MAMTTRVVEEYFWGVGLGLRRNSELGFVRPSIARDYTNWF